MSSDEIIDITPQELAKCADDDCLIIDTIRKPAKERNSRRTQQTNEINVLQMINNLSRQILSHDENLAPARTVRSVSTVVQSSSSEIVYDSRKRSREPETRNSESHSTASTSSSSAKTTTPKSASKSGSKPGSKSSLECPICLETLEEIRQNGKQFVSTTCGHVFCDNCLNEHHKSLGPANFKCPTCRKKLTKAKIHTLYI